MRAIGFVAVVTTFLIFSFPLADAHAGVPGGNGLNTGMDFLWIAIIILAAKLSNLVERFGQPSVLGELLVGIIFGNMALAGFNFFEPIRQDIVIRFLAEIGVVILLFQVGLESNIQRMLKVGPQAFLVAIVGVVAPFLLGTVVVGPLLLPELSFKCCSCHGTLLHVCLLFFAHLQIFCDLFIIPMRGRENLYTS